jgi:hypothetical protein
MTIKEIEAELNRLGYKLTFDNVIINRSNKITNVQVQVTKDSRIKFLDTSGNFLCSYPNKMESVARFLNEFWYANVSAK